METLRALERRLRRRRGRDERRVLERLDRRRGCRSWASMSSSRRRPSSSASSGPARPGSRWRSRRCTAFAAGFIARFGAHEPALQPVAIRLVDPVEEEERGDVVVARVALDDLPCSTAPASPRRSAACSRCRSSPPCLRVSVCQPASSSSQLDRSAGLRAAATPASSNVGCAVPLKPSQNACSRAVEVRDADLRPRRALVRRIGVHERVRMQRDVVHDRLLAAGSCGTRRRRP